MPVAPWSIGGTTAGTEDDEGPLALEPRALYDAAIVGVARRFNATFLVYDKEKLIDILVTEMTDDEDEEDPRTSALEHFEFNIIGGWVGEGTPAFLLSEEEGADYDDRRS